MNEKQTALDAVIILEREEDISEQETLDFEEKWEYGNFTSWEIKIPGYME